MNDTHDVHIGPQDGDGTELTIVRSHLPDNDPHSDHTVIKHHCHGVESIDVQDPYQMGTLEPESMIEQIYTTGRKEHINGVITEVEGLE